MTIKHPISVAVIGNPNVGKSSVFNAITGSAQVIGNWCGKTTEACTVEAVYEGRQFSFTDLPGIYGFGHSSLHEITADKYLNNHHPDVPLIIVDSVNLERNLYLALEVLERYQKAVVVLSKMDSAEEHGIVIDVPKLSSLLGVPVIPAVTKGHWRTSDLFQALAKVADGEIRPDVQKISYPSEIEQAIENIGNTLHRSRSGSKRWLAVETAEQQSEDWQTQIISTRLHLRQ